jgi:plastocyanin
MNRRKFLVTAGSALTVGVAGCIDGGEAVGDHDVGMTQVSFRPEELTVEAGTTVTFRNTSSHSHTVTAYQGAYPDGAEFFATGGYDSQSEARRAWESENAGLLNQGEVFEHEFSIPGRYGYFCIPHIDAGMEGAVIVTESGSDS